MASYNNATQGNIRWKRFKC